MRIRWGSGGSTWQVKGMEIRAQVKTCQTIAASSQMEEGRQRDRMLVELGTSQLINETFTIESWATGQQSVGQVLQIYNWTTLNRIEYSCMVKQFLQKT